MATTINPETTVTPDTTTTPETTITETRRSTYNADSFVADRQAERQATRPAQRQAGVHPDLTRTNRPAAPTRYPGRWLDRLFHRDPASPSPRDLVLAEADPTHSVRSIQR